MGLCSSSSSPKIVIHYVSNDIPQLPTYSEAVQTDNSEHLFLEALKYFERNEYLRAKEYVNRAIYLNPHASKYHNLLSCILCEQKEYQKSLKENQISIQLNPNEPIYYAYQADILGHLNHYTQGIEVANMAIQLAASSNYIYHFAYYVKTYCKLGLYQNNLFELNQLLVEWRECRNLFENAPKSQLVNYNCKLSINEKSPIKMLKNHKKLEEKIIKSMNHLQVINERKLQQTDQKETQEQSVILVIQEEEKKEDKKKEDNSSLLCVVCFIEQRNIVLNPCNHICCCSRCSSLLHKCPICCCKIQNRTVVYIS